MSWKFFGEWLDRILKHDINKPIAFQPEVYRDPKNIKDPNAKAKEIWKEIPVKTRQKMYKKHREVMIENNSFLFWMGIGILTCIILAYSISVLYTILIPTTTISLSVQGDLTLQNCTVPSPDWVDNFCQSKGYLRGWVYQGCGENQVDCYKEGTDGASYFHCIDIGV